MNGWRACSVVGFVVGLALQVGSRCLEVWWRAQLGLPLAPRRVARVASFGVASVLVEAWPSAVAGGQTALGRG